MQRSNLGSEEISVLVKRLALPSIVAQLVNLLYNIVDKIFVGHMQENAAISLAGLGVSAPLILLISAFSACVSGGGGPLSAIAMGKDNHEEAERILGASCFLLTVFSIFITTFALIFRLPLLKLFGATEGILPYAEAYSSVYILGTIFVMISIGLNAFITAQGQPRVAMISLVLGAITNVILDPIFIFVFEMGVKGAAFATVISQAFSASFVFNFLRSRESIIRLKKEYFRFDLPLIKKILSLGLSGFVMVGTESAVSIAFNRGLSMYGTDLHIGTMAIMNSAMQLLTMPVNGFVNGIQPIVSFNYGAKKYDRVKKTLKIMLIVGTIYTVLYCLFVYINPGAVAALFTKDMELKRLVEKLLPIFMAGLFPFGIQMCARSFFVGTGNAKTSLLIATLRKVLLLIPLIIILAKFFSVMGVIYAEPISDIISVTVAGILFAVHVRKLGKEEKKL